MAKLALYEPPYCAPKTPDDYLDRIIGNDHASILFDLLPKISVPTMVFDGGIGPAWQREACEAIAGTKPPIMKFGYRH